MTLDEFFNKYNGVKNTGNTPENKGECVGLSSLWMDNFNVPHVYGHAKDLYDNAPEELFAKIPNTPEGIVQDGDIVVWGQGYNGTYGHTGVAKGLHDINRFDCFEQNDPLGSLPHIKNYSYAYVIGWLRPKTAPISSDNPPTGSGSPAAIDDKFKYDFGGFLGILELGAIRSIVLDQRSTIVNMDIQRSALQQQLSDCQNSQSQSANILQQIRDLFHKIIG